MCIRDRVLEETILKSLRSLFLTHILSLFRPSISLSKYLIYSLIMRYNLPIQVEFVLNILPILLNQLFKILINDPCLLLFLLAYYSSHLSPPLPSHHCLNGPSLLVLLISHLNIISFLWLF